ncbi:AMP-binding protein [Amycolatopsis acidiphila]|uniref:AMP-binding protein n=1 Tax=Amycolatopsis acidiphila TaxID=715473 RepID=A0A558AM04_9PSEU|nr:AMP-binding protein [Amycolatopsis acidiphila]TVT25295.1 AMP-binding protein [Amycolatopsis acidiphila]UIJ62418.1 AMP-binding protein [Amycolatopsis acidiphila]GHG83579.1 cyclohexanecarboxylate-CoA ligase [Amycolatopsis acidiphila]
MSTVTVRERYDEADSRAYYQAGYWQADGLAELAEARAASHGDKVFVSDGTSARTYAAFREQGTRLAAGLRRLGVRRGDRVAVQLPNWTEFAVIAFAVSRLGAVLVPIMPIYRAAEVGYVLQHAGAKVAITCEDFRGFGHLGMFDGLRADLPDLEALVVVRGDGAVTLDELMDAPGTGLEAPPSPDDEFLIVYTSGTTARPKGCLHTFNTVCASAAAIARSVHYTEHDVQFGPSPITHSTGLVTSVILPLLTGASSHLMEAWEPGEGLQRIAEHGCTAAVTATPFLQMLTAAYDPDRHDASSLRLWVCAGSPVPGSIVRRASEQFAGCRVLSLYGRSENFLTTMCTVDDPPGRSATSDGAAIAGASVKIVDEAGEEVPRGTEGDIAYRGPSHMLQYYGDPEQTAALFTPDGHSRSGDLGVMDADGYVRVTGRLKDIVIRGGLNISARELEDLLVEHPMVEQVAVVGMPDDRLGERVCAYVVPAPGTRPRLADLTGYLRGRDVATPKLPERLELLDRLPLTATGKVRKHVLRDDVTAKLAEQ